MNPSDPKRICIDLSAGPVSYTDEGTGPAIVLVHGVPGSARDFRYLAPHLVASARVVRVELPGFGETPIETGSDPSPRGRALCVIETIEALGLRNVLLVGHSQGGIVGVSACVQRSELFRGLALLSSPGLRPHAMMRRAPFGLMSKLLRRRILGPMLAPVVRGLFAMGGFKRYPDHELYRTIHCIAATSLDENAQNVARLSTPTLVAWCEDDPMIQPEISRELADAAPDGPRLRFATGGHNPQKTQAASIAAALLGWQDQGAPQ